VLKPAKLRTMIKERLERAYQQYWRLNILIPNTRCVCSMV
jgi:hypothetical protein